MLVGNVSKLGLQAAAFILIARNLGPKQYGAFIGVTAITSMIYPFVANGIGRVMIKAISRDPSCYAQQFGKTIVWTMLAGLLLGVLAFGICELILASVIDFKVVAMIVASDFVVFRLTDLAAYVFQAHDRLIGTAALAVGTSSLRLLGIIAVIATHRPTLFAYAASYLATSLFASIAAMCVTVACFGWPEISFAITLAEIRESALFSAGATAETVYNDLDKAMIARLGSLAAAGTYAAASRILDVAFLPVRSILSSTYPSFFRHGRDGVPATVRFCVRYFLISLAYGSAIAIALAVFAPVLVTILGKNFSGTGSAIRWMAVVLIFRSVHSFAADVLTGAGHQDLRTSIQFIVASFNVGANVYFIPRYSWLGAAWVTLASECLLALLLVSAVVKFAWKEHRSMCKPRLVLSPEVAS